MKNKAPTIVTASTILNLLLKRHSEDICVSECKNGPTWTSRKMRKFDLFVMKRSYSQPMTWIYEIKISRQDFLRDDKWQGYLQYCTDFYFVAPCGIIDPTEVPEKAGLFLTSKNGTRLYCKKKAPHRTDIEIPTSLYLYILMSRTKIVTSSYNNNNRANKSNEAYWRQWLAEKEEKQEIGHNISNRLRKLYQKNVIEVKKRQNRLELRIEDLENVKKILNKMGFDENNLGWNQEEKIKNRIAEINAGLPEKDIMKHLESAVLNIQNTIKVIQNSGNLKLHNLNKN